MNGSPASLETESDPDLKTAFHEAISRDARAALRLAAPTFAVLLSVEGLSHLFAGPGTNAAMAIVPIVLGVCSGVLGWALWFRPSRVHRPEWMVLVPWAGTLISMIQHIAVGLSAGSILFVVATLIGIGPLVLSPIPSAIAVSCTSALLAYSCYLVFDHMPWIYPLLLTPISLLISTNRRAAIYESERRRRLERALATQAAEVEGLKRLRSVSAGVAHHFNNLLAVLIGRISVAREEALAGGDVHDDLEAAQEAADRAAQLVRDLQAASQPNGAARREITDVEGLLRDIVTEPREGVDLRWEVQGPLPSIWGDRKRIQRAIQHVVDNAVESGAQRVEIRVSATDAAENKLRLTVEDDGPGIAEEDLERVFDPFFTTRGPGRAGLGLAFARSALEHGGGGITISSAAGGGVQAQLDLATSP